MWDTRTVEVVLHLPHDLARDVEEVRRDHPDFLQKVIRYGLTRRRMFQELRRSMDSNSTAEA